MDDNTSKSASDIKDGAVRGYKAVKRPPADADNPMVKVLESIVSGLEGSLGKRSYLCGNPDCGTLIIFHTNIGYLRHPRPHLTAKRYGARPLGG